MSTGASIGAARSAALLLVACLLTGCAGARSVKETVSGWFGMSETTPRAYYVGSARARLHREPDGSSEVVGTLGLHEGVLAYRVDRDFTYVRSERTGRSGWLRTAELIDQLPPAQKAPRAGEAAAKPAEPPAPQEATAEPEPEPAAEPEPATEPAPTPEKSVFDPY